MDLERRLRECLAAPDPGAHFATGVMARLGDHAWQPRRAAGAGREAEGRGRRRSRFILIGTIAVVSAAAAMLAWRLSTVSPRPLVSAPASVNHAPTREAPVEAAPAAPRASEMKRAAVPPAPRPALAQEESPHYTVLAMPLREEAQDRQEGESVEAFYAALLAELRKVPGLTLRVQGNADSNSSPPPDFVLTVTSLATTEQSSGAVTFNSSEGPGRGDSVTVSGTRALAIPGGASTIPSGASITTVSHGETAGGVSITSAFDPSGPLRPVEIKVEPVAKSPAGLFRSTFDIGAAAVPNGRPPCPAGLPAAWLPATCMTPAQLVAKQVELLRMRAFPADPSIQRQLAARIRNDALSEMERHTALGDLLSTSLASPDVRLQAASISAIGEFVNSLPTEPRSQVWYMLESSSDPGMIQLLLEPLRGSPDVKARLSILNVLASRHGEEPAIHAAIDTIAQQDPQPMMRLAARTVLYGPDAWKSDAAAALRDTSRSYAQRLEPLLLGTQLTRTPAVAIALQAFMDDAQNTNLVAGLVRDNKADASQLETTTDALKLLSHSDNQVVFDLFVDVLRDAAQPDGRMLALQTMTPWLMSHQDDPRLREIRETGDLQVRATIEQMLNIFPPPQ